MNRRSPVANWYGGGALSKAAERNGEGGEPAVWTGWRLSRHGRPNAKT